MLSIAKLRQIFGVSTLNQFGTKKQNQVIELYMRHFIKRTQCRDLSSVFINSLGKGHLNKHLLSPSAKYLDVRKSRVHSMLFRQPLSLKANNSCYYVMPSTLYATLANNSFAKDENSDFKSVLPELIKDLTDASKSSDVDEIRNWFSKVLQYNVMGGKNIRGLSVVYSYKLLSRDVSGENVKMSYILGWCVEMLQGFFLVIDDVQDSSETRRGMPAWYKLEEVGSASAINDGLLIESGIYKILKIYFRHKPYYVDLVELFHDTTLKTLYGQRLDLMSAKLALKRDFSKFTMDRYETIVKYKTAYYTFHLPVALALYMAGIRDETVHKQSKDILLDIGRFFQIQDDYLDCFGDIKITGKIGSDIKEGKCTWLVVNALSRANVNQLKVFQRNYGSSDPDKILKVKELFEELGLPKLYKQYEDEANERIIKSIHRLKGVPHEIFTNLLKILYKRIG